MWSTVCVCKEMNVFINKVCTRCIVRFPFWKNYVDGSLHIYISIPVNCEVTRPHMQSLREYFLVLQMMYCQDVL